MALTNEQITAQNFKDFYGQIRPYLNGQVPTFANAFSRSDLYSTDEKIVGTFTDGKPLYQKAWTGLSVAVTTATDAWQVISGVNVPNGRFVSAIFLANDSKISITPQECWLRDTTGNLETLYWPENRTITDVVLRYIKTTDTAIKVGTGNDYSTDEQIVGTWIDGKLIYRKVFTGLYIQFNANAWTALPSSVNIQNIDRLISSRITRTGTDPTVGPYSTTIDSVSIEYYRNTGSFKGNSPIGFGGCDTIVFEYTKAT